MEDQFIDCANGQLRCGFTRQDVENVGEMGLGIAVLIQEQFRHAGVPMEAPIVVKAVFDGGQPFAGLADVAEVNHGAHHAKGDFRGLLVLRSLHGLAEGF